VSVESIISIEINEGSLARLKELEERLKKLSKTQIQFEPSFVGFDKAVREKLKALNYAPVKVQIEPDFTGFRRSIVQQIQGINVPSIKVKLDVESANSNVVAGPPVGEPAKAPTADGNKQPKTSGSGPSGRQNNFAQSILAGGGHMAMAALKLPFQALDLGFKVAMKSFNLLASAVKGILGLVGRTFKALGIGVAAGAGIATAGTMFLFKQAMDVAQKSFFTRTLVGANVGDLPRLEATLGRVANVKNLMSGVAQQQNALFSLPFAMMGMSQGQAGSIGTERLTEQVLRRARSAAKQFGANEITMSMFGLGDVGLTTEDLQRLKGTSDEEFEGTLEYNRKMADATKVPREREYREFEMKRGVGMARLDALIKNELVDMLKPMERLFASIFNSFERKDGKGAIHSLMDKFGRGLERLAQAFETDKWGELAKDAFNSIKDAGMAAMDWLWAQFKSNYPEAAKHLEELGNAIKPMLPTWKDLKELGGSIKAMLPSWSSFIEGINEMPRIFEKLQDSFYIMLETIDRAWQSLAHPFSDYARSPFATAPEGTRARETQLLGDYMSNMMNEESIAMNKESGAFGYKKAIQNAREMFPLLRIDNNPIENPKLPNLGDVSQVGAGGMWSEVEKAFLQVLAGLESKGNYRSIVGGGLFEGMGHPRIGRKIGDTITHAAGAYQDQPSTWDWIKKKFGFSEEQFGDPAVQDLGNFGLAEEIYNKNGKNLRQDLKDGKFASIAEALSSTWEALPGSGSKRPLVDVGGFSELMNQQIQKSGGQAITPSSNGGGSISCANLPMDKNIYVIIENNTRADVSILASRMPGALCG